MLGHVLNSRDELVTSVKSVALTPNVNYRHTSTTVKCGQTPPPGLQVLTSRDEWVALVKSS